MLALLRSSSLAAAVLAVPPLAQAAARGAARAPADRYRTRRDHRATATKDDE